MAHVLSSHAARARPKPQKELVVVRLLYDLHTLLCPGVERPGWVCTFFRGDGFTTCQGDIFYDKKNGRDGRAALFVRLKKKHRTTPANFFRTIPSCCSKPQGLHFFRTGPFLQFAPSGFSEEPSFWSRRGSTRCAGRSSVDREVWVGVLF